MAEAHDEFAVAFRAFLDCIYDEGATRSMHWLPMEPEAMMMARRRAAMARRSWLR